jgi:tripartite-type tricarboxylate transporter receptor subunit TctC
MEPNPASPAATSAFLKEEIGKWGTIIRTAGIKLD